MTGGVAEIGNGTVKIDGVNNENVAFTATGSGGLIIADTHANTSAYGGRIAGFGAGHVNRKQFIDLTSVTFVSGVLSASYASAASHTSGTLTVTSGGTANVVATIALIGSYVTSNFHLSAGADNSVVITDPGPATNGGVVNGNMALFVNYLAASFATGGINGGGVLISATAEPVPLTHLHHA